MMFQSKIEQTSNSATSSITSSNVTPTARSCSSNKKCNVAFLLHCADGVVPFLTPALLRQCFPSEQYYDRLLLGLAVRDVCAVPVYETALSEETGDDGKNAQRGSKRKRKRSPKTPSGYTFTPATSSPLLDHWLQPYQRVTVPTFHTNPVGANRIVNQKGVIAQKGHDAAITGATGRSNVVGATTTAATLSVTTDQSMSLWTPNGRIALTPAMYNSVAGAMQSQIQIPLYDDSGDTTLLPFPKETTPTTITSATHWIDDHPTSETTKCVDSDHDKFEVAERTETTPLTAAEIATPPVVSHARYKRAKVAVHRTQCFTDTMLMERSLRVWVPWLVNTSEDLASVQWDWIHSQQQMQQEENGNETGQARGIAGIALIGWNRLVNAGERQLLLQTLTDPIMKCTSGTNTLAVLSTDSLQQMIELAAWARDIGNHPSYTRNTAPRVVIGSDLPARWARAKQVFLGRSPGDMREKAEGTEDAINGGVPHAPTVKYNDDGCVDLKVYAESDKVQLCPWYRDQRPLLPSCVCWTCQTYTRSYVYHLVCAHEILAEILLFVHNLHHLLEFLTQLQER